MNCLDFEVKRSKVKVTMRSNLVKKDKGVEFYFKACWGLLYFLITDTGCLKKTGVTIIFA